MTWTNILEEFLTMITRIIVAVCIPLLLSYISEKVENDKAKILIERAFEIVSKCVQTVNQTMVDQLKKEGAFDKDAQQLAFQTCARNVLTTLDEETRLAIEKSFGSIQDWIVMAIESSVREHKN